MSVENANSKFSEAIANRARKAAKSNNKYGNPIVMKSKVLAAISDPQDAQDSIFIAESAGCVRRMTLSVRKAISYSFHFMEPGFVLAVLTYFVFIIHLVV